MRALILLLALLLGAPAPAQRVGFDIVTLLRRPTAAPAVSVSYLRLPNLTSNMTETADSSGWDYVPSDDPGNYDSVRSAYSTLRLASGQDGGWYGKLGAGLATASPGPIIGLSTNSAPYSYGDINYGIYFSAGGGSSYGSVGGGTAVNNVVAAAGDLVGFLRTGSTVVARVSKDNGASWTIAYSWSGAATGALTAFYQSGTNGSKGTLIQPIKIGPWE